MSSKAEHALDVRMCKDIISHARFISKFKLYFRREHMDFTLGEITLHYYTLGSFVCVTHREISVSFRSQTKELLLLL